VDTGKHNDLVMALAHACDQFSSSLTEVPFMMGKLEKGEWQGGKVRKSTGKVFKVVRRRSL
jgi:hypothetical protein